MKNWLKCAKCGIKYNIYHGWQALDVNAGAIGLCENCAATKSYSTHNNVLTKGNVNKEFTFGCELEGIASNKDYLVLCNEYNGFVPTSDGSLSYGGVELKSPIWQSLNGLKKTIATASKVLDLTHYSCGQHIHIGHKSKLNNSTMYYIRQYYHALFVPLCEAMQEDEAYHELWGRTFSDYCEPIYNNSYVDNRYNFINVNNAKTIEFRLCKFNNVNQYYWLFELARDIISCIINNFIEYINDNDITLLEHKAKLTGKKIVKLYEKYRRGEAHCQRPSRNERDW